jgi:hypothetical protein
MRFIFITFFYWLFFSNASAQMETFSKLIDFYPLNGEIGMQIYTEDDGYLLILQHKCVSHPNLSTCSSVIKLDFNGEVLWITELDMGIDWLDKFVEMHDAYYLGGVLNSGESKMQLMKLSKKGEITWKMNIIHVVPSAGVEILARTEEDQLIIANPKIREPPAFGFIPNLIFMDTLGNLIDTIFYNQDFRWTLNGNIVQLDSRKFLVAFNHCAIGNCTDNRPAGVICIDRDTGVQWRTLWYHGWLPAINRVEYIDMNTIAVIYQTRDYALPTNISAPPAVFYLDTSGQILDSVVLWSNHLNQVRNTFGLWERGLVACGQQYRNAESSNKGPEMGWLFRVGENKEVLWQRSYLDTIYAGRSGRFNHIKQTIDGGFIMIGALTNMMTGVNETHVWLMKVDSMGCLTPGCDSINIISSTEPVAFPSGVHLQLYPNPATSEVTLSLPLEAPDQDLLVSLLSSSGQVLQQQPYLHPAIRFDTSGLPPGMYYMTVHRKGSLVGVEKLVVK